MNDRLPTSAISPPNHSASSERGIDRLFGELEALYGSKFADMWAGADIERVKAKWTEKLLGFADHPGVIRQAVDALDDRPSPPTLPEFMSLCRDAARRAGTAHRALPHKPTPEERQHQHELAKRLGDVMGAKKSADGIDEHWATHPRSQHHLRFIFDAAANDKRFGKCIDQMVADGICTADGKLLRSYSGGTWQAAA